MYSMYDKAVVYKMYHLYYSRLAVKQLSKSKYCQDCCDAKPSSRQLTITALNVVYDKHVSTISRVEEVDNTCILCRSCNPTTYHAQKAGALVNERQLWSMFYYEEMIQVVDWEQEPLCDQQVCMDGLWVKLLFLRYEFKRKITDIPMRIGTKSQNTDMFLFN